MVKSQPDDDPVLADFFQWITKTRLTGNWDASVRCNQHFVPYPELQELFQDLNRVRKLLQALFPECAEPPVAPDQICKSYCRVFSILLLIGKGRYIRHFVQHGSLADQHLPFHANSPPASFPARLVDQDFLTSFCDTQWGFCAPVFEDNMSKRFEDNDVLPIIHKEKIAGGGSATTYKIVLHPAYNKLSPRSTSNLDPNDLSADTFVIKSYETQEAEEYYLKETDAFRTLRSSGGHSNIIGYHGSFIRGGTYNLILEYANEGTLEDYFWRTKAPLRGEDILRLWQGLSKLVGALKMIHNVPRSESDRLHLLQGWHQDVKPANILVKRSKDGSAFDCLFMLADLGLSHFKRTVSPQSETPDKDTQGTKTYGAPECHRMNGHDERYALQVKPAVDIYSLGCVFSEAAIWIVRGIDGLEEYRRQRNIAIQKTPNLNASDCFHDGEKTLSMVYKTHDELADYIRRSDHVTGSILIIISNEMLEEEDVRANARQLHVKFNRILSEAEKKLHTHAATRYSHHSGGPRPAATPQLAIGDGPKTPPQVPKDLPQLQYRTPQHHVTDPFERTSSPESMASSQVHSHRPNHNFGFPIRSVSKRFSPLSRIGGTRNTHAQYNGHYENPNYDQDQITKSPATSVSSEWCPSIPQNSSPREMYGSLSRVGPNNDRAGASLTPISTHKPEPVHVGQHQVYSNGDQGHSVDSPAGYPGNRRGINSGNSPSDNGDSGYGRNSAAPARNEQAAVDIRGSDCQPSPQHSPPPYLTVDEAKRWKVAKKNGEKPILSDAGLIDSLNDRDLVFLIDNSTSMRPYQKDVRDLFELLAYMVKDKDPDGIELHTTISNKTERSKDTSPLVNSLIRKTYDGNSNIRLELGRIIGEYGARLRETGPSKSWRRSKKTKDLNLYIFTDGLWHPGSDPTELLSDLVQTLKQHMVYNEHFGIQFIRFGSDQEGIDRLDRLDSGLNLPMDVVDTEPADGNVLKMLVGANNKWLDGDDLSNRGEAINSVSRPVSTATYRTTDQMCRKSP